MNKTRRTLVAMLALAATTGAAAQGGAWPSRTITLVSPYAPGGTTDILARLLAVKLQERLGQNVIVENKAGAGGNVGTDAVAKAQPDGYTFLVGSSGPLVMSPALYPRLPYKPLTDFTPVTPLARAPFVLAVNPKSGLNSVRDVLAQGRADKLNFASAGSGTPQHIIGEMFNVRGGMKMAHIPYRGSAPAINDLIGGQVPLTFENSVLIMPHVKAGKLKALAVTSARRSAVFPELPTLAESGLPGFHAEPWYGMVAPAGLPPEILQRMNALVREILATTEVKARLYALGAEPLPQSPEAFRTFMAEETKRWAAVVQASGATVD